MHDLKILIFHENPISLRLFVIYGHKVFLRSPYLDHELAIIAFHTNFCHQIAILLIHLPPLNLPPLYSFMTVQLGR